jgi:hypothetical protein
VVLELDPPLIPQPGSLKEHFLVLQFRTHASIFPLYHRFILWRIRLIRTFRNTCNYGAIRAYEIRNRIPGSRYTVLSFEAVLIWRKCYTMKCRSQIIWKQLEELLVGYSAIPLLQRINRSPMFIMMAFFRGWALMNSPGAYWFSTSNPPQSSWNNMVMEPQSEWASILALVPFSNSTAGIGG